MEESRQCNESGIFPSVKAEKQKQFEIQKIVELNTI